MRRLGPHSRPHRLDLVDYRTAEGKVIKAHMDELTADLGGNPMGWQKGLIERAAVYYLRIRLADRLSLEHPMDTSQTRHYLALCNSYTRILRQLGLMKAPAPSPTMDDFDWLDADKTAAPQS